jgi:hypothetical protein
MLSAGSAILGRIPALPFFAPVEDLAHARDLVRGHAAYGMEILKEYSQQRRDSRQYLVQAARELGLGIVGEPNSDLARRVTMVLDGFTAAEHSFNLPVQSDLIRLFAASGTCHTPTLAIPDGGAPLIDYFTARMTPGDHDKIRRLFPPNHVDDYRRWRVEPRDELWFVSQAAAATALSRAGGCSTVGSHSTRVGIGMHWEIWARVLAGATPLEALRDATFSGAHKIGLEDQLGSLRAGKLADFLVLEGNPLVDIEAIRSIEYVVKNGFVYDGESMDALWPERKQRSRFFWQTEAEYQAARARVPDFSRWKTPPGAR